VAFPFHSWSSLAGAAVLAMPLSPVIGHTQ
jgi:hypothetical protein